MRLRGPLWPRSDRLKGDIDIRIALENFYQFKEDAEQDSFSQLDELGAGKKYLIYVTTPGGLVNYALALEWAQCPRVVKGYGDTHIRGRQNFDAMMAALPRLRGSKDAAKGLRALREAALADDTGKQLAAALQELPA